MLKSVIRTDEETKEYLIRLKRRLEEQRKAPVEGMAEFFAARINEYESVHLDNYPEIYEHTADFLDAGIFFFKYFNFRNDSLQFVSV